MLVKLNDGTKLVDTFLDNTSRHIVLKEHGRIRRDAIKKMSPYIEEGVVWVTVRSPSDFDSAQAKDFPNLCPLREWIHSAPAHYETCMKALTADGCCEKHGKVRYTVTEAAREHKERMEKDKPALRHEPPRRRPGGRTVSRKLHVRKVHGW